MLHNVLDIARRLQRPGACRSPTQRQFNGCDCFGSRSTFLTSTRPRCFQTKNTETSAGHARRNSGRTPVLVTRVASPGPTLHAPSVALASQSLGRSRSPQPFLQQQSTRPQHSQEQRGPAGRGELPVCLDCTFHNSRQCCRAPTTERS